MIKYIQTTQVSCVEKDKKATLPGTEYLHATGLTPLGLSDSRGLPFPDQAARQALRAEIQPP